MAFVPLKSPPIQEAIIDFHVAFRELVALSALDIHKDIIERFPKKEDVIVHSGQIVYTDNVKDEPVVESDSVQNGYKYSSRDQKFIVQSTMRGLTISHLWPYSDWVTLSALAKELWAIYVKHAKPISITRIGVRYINNLQLPAPATPLTDWLVNCPGVPSASEEDLTGFFHRTYADYGSNKLIFTQALEPMKHEKKIPVIIDNDAYALKTLDVDDPEIWETCDELREIKNKVFYSSLTDKALELYR